MDFVIESLPSMLDEVVNEIEMSTCASEEIDVLQYPARRRAYESAVPQSIRRDHMIRSATNVCLV